MKVKGVIDSLNFSSSDLEALFVNDDYSIETVKSVGVFEPTRWKEAFNSSLTRNIIEAKILHTSTGLELPIKRHSRSQTKQILEFAGLHGYNEKSKLLSVLLKELWSDIQDEVITRLDIAIDFKGKIPNKVIKELCKSRTPFKWINSTYLKTESEKKKNYQVNILLYPKHKKENLDYELERLEFSFGSGYFRGAYKIKELAKIYKKIAKTIKRFTGLEVVIKQL